jgi:hypothetical protein
MVWVLLLELLALYFLSRWVTQAIFTFFLLLFRVRAIAVSFLLVLEFPGTVLHELAHLFTAEILGVRTGKMRLEPESIREEAIRSGSVEIAQTDPFRRYAIGLAPIFVGMIALTAIAYFLPPIVQSVLNSSLPWWNNSNTFLLLGLGYFLFAISNSMFSSPEDIKGIWPFLLILIAISISIYLIGFRIDLTGQILTIVTQILTTLTQSLGLVIGLNIVILLLLWLVTFGLTRLFHVRIVRPNA